MLWTMQCWEHFSAEDSAVLWTLQCFRQCSVVDSAVLLPVQYWEQYSIVDSEACSEDWTRGQEDTAALLALLTSPWGNQLTTNLI